MDGKLTRNDSHEYFVDDKPIPGVTQVLTGTRLASYDHIQKERLEIAQLRGTYVHLATQLYDEGDLDESTLTDEKLKGRFNGYKKFLYDSGFKVDKIEVMGFSPELWVAGQIDRSGTIGRKKVVLDLKPPNPYRHWRFQTAFYSLIFFPGFIPYRICLMLNENGTYKVEEHPMQEFPYDRKVAEAALTVFKELEGK